jgi:hypothetical protein
MCASDHDREAGAFAKRLDRRKNSAAAPRPKLERRHLTPLLQCRPDTRFAFVGSIHKTTNYGFSVGNFGHLHSERNGMADPRSALPRGGL